MRGDGYPLPRGATMLAFGSVMTGLLLASLNQTILTTAAPTVVSDLDGLTHYSWIFTAYMVAQAVSAPIWAKLSDIYGRRPFYSGAILVFMAGSLIGATAGSMAQLVVARAVQGAAAGALIPLTMVVISDLVPASARNRWQSLVGVVFAIASIFGPTAGGLIADNASWRWVFVVPLPIGALAFVAAWRSLRIPTHPGLDRSVDYLGAALLSAAISLALLALVTGAESGWAAPEVIAMAAGAAAALAVFLRWERHAPEPIVPLHLYRHRLYSVANLTTFLMGAGMFAAIMFVPLFAQGAMGDSATSSGLVLSPLMVAMIVSSTLSGQLISATGRYRWALLSGPPLMGLGFALLLRLDAGSAELDVVACTVVLGTGLGFLLQNLVVVMQNAVPPRYLGAATGSAQFSRVVGGAVGVTVLGALLTAGLADRGITAGAGGSLLAPGAEAVSRAVREDIAAALEPLFAIGIGLMAAAWVAAFFIPERPLRPVVRDEAAEPELEVVG